MAQLIPNTPIHGSPPEIIRLFQVFKRLPDPIVVLQRLPAVHGPGPDFCLLQDERAILLAVSCATPHEAQLTQQPGLFENGGVSLGQAEATRLAEFVAGETAVARLPTAILFPNLSDKQLQALPGSGVGGAWVGKERLAPGQFHAWLQTQLTASLPGAQIDRLRQRFTPEVVVPAAFTVRRPRARRTGAELTPYLLDYDQEQVLKMDLNLPEAGLKTARAFQLRLVNGVAGSGKSLIVIYRAHLLRQLFPQKRILILTHNRALRHDLWRRYARLSQGDRGVRVQTFMGWCRKQWPPDRPWHDIISHRDRVALARQAWLAHLRDTAVSEQMLLDEIDWYKDRLLFGEGDYLTADRTGRGFALSGSMRQRLFAAMQAYHNGLQRRQLMDWGDVPRQMWRFQARGDVALPRYDVILIDEAQFFAPIWFEIIKKMLTPQTGHLFLVADASQGFLKRGQSWLSSGMDVRGRVHRLRKSYRTTREILDFATLLYRRRLPADEDEIVSPDLMQMPRGVMPVIIPLTSEQDEVTRVINEVRQLAAHGTPWNHILLIHANGAETQPILARLNLAFGADTAVDPTQAPADNQIRVCPLNAATGLESPIVFLMGVRDLYETEQSIRLSDEERAELIRDNTRKLYMAITRAGQRLVITYAGPIPDELAQLALGKSGGDSAG